MTMTANERRAEFWRLFRAIPGRNIDRLNYVAKTLHYKVNTVRTMTISPERPSGTKVMPEAKLLILRREMEREGILKAEAEADAA